MTQGVPQEVPHGEPQGEPEKVPQGMHVSPESRSFGGPV